MYDRVITPEPNDRYDYSGVTEFGRLTHLRPRPYAPLNPNLTKQIAGDLEQVRFDPDKDVICLTGNIITVAVMLALIAAQHPAVKVLMFDARTSCYRLRIIDTTTHTVPQ